MRCAVAGFLVLSLVSVMVFGQTPNQTAKRGTTKTGTQGKTLKICQGVPIPEGYIIVAYESSSSCAHGAYVLKKDDGSKAPATASRPRKVANETVNSIPLNPPEEISTYAGPAPSVSSTSLDDKEEVSEGDVVRIDTNLVTVPVTVLDRNGRFISDVQREEFKVFENGVEQKLAYPENVYELCASQQHEGETVQAQPQLFRLDRWQLQKHAAWLRDYCRKTEQSECSRLGCQRCAGLSEPGSET